MYLKSELEEQSWEEDGREEERTLVSRALEINQKIQGRGKLD
jgi:hypothetical protein